MVGVALYGHMCRKPLLALAALLAKGWNLPRGGKYNLIHCSCCAAWGSQFDFGRFVSDSMEWYEDRGNVEIPLRLILNNASRWSVYLDAGLDYLTHALGAGYYRQIDDEGMKLHLYRDKEHVADLAVDKNATGNVWGYVLETSLSRDGELIQQLCQKAEACPHIRLSIAP